MTQIRSSYVPGKPGRESPETIGIDEQGNEHALPALLAGPGDDNKNPEPGTPEWEQVIQAGLDSAAAADPPASQEIALWQRVANEKMPLDFVERNDAILTLKVPPGWEPSVLSMMADEELREAIVEERDRENARIYNSFADLDKAHAGPEGQLFEILSNALDDAPFTVTVSSHVEQAIHNGDVHVYPPEEWGQLVSDAIEAIVVRLIPAEDGVVIGEVQDDDAVLQALELLAKATGGGASAG